MRSRYILGIETTCDETSIGIFDLFANKIIAHETSSSAGIHANFGGVVPELASRKHEENINHVLNNALDNANLAFNQIDLIAYSSEPGLPGCLFVGKVFAEFLHFFSNKPILKINHLYAHIFSSEINKEPATFPAIGLVVSGGHTAFYLLKNYREINLLHQTHDDAIGEVYDKVGRELNLSYPSGPKIDHLFSERYVNNQIFNFSFKQHEHISFSGLKTAVISYIKQNHPLKKDIPVVASTFQKKIIGIILYFLNKNITKYPSIQCVLVGGGVSANLYLRSELRKLNQRILIPEQQYTGDNGAMVAYYASRLVQRIT